MRAAGGAARCAAARARRAAARVGVRRRRHRLHATRLPRLGREPRLRLSGAVRDLPRRALPRRSPRAARHLLRVRPGRDQPEPRREPAGKQRREPRAPGHAAPRSSARDRAAARCHAGARPGERMGARTQGSGARNLDEFKDALQRMDVAQTFVYVDVGGNIAYFTSGDIPVREDLEAGAVNGVPPWFVRNGQGGNEWLPVINRQPHQATAHEILPFAEMPQIVNPAAGYFVNGNNDPAGVTRDNNPLNQLRPGGGLSYMAYSWNRAFRAARIEKRLRDLLETGDRRVSFEQMQAIQADVVVRDGEVLTRYIVRAFDRALSDPAADAQLRALSTDARVAEAVGRLRSWNGWTPTGIAQGYDEGDAPGALQTPSASEVQASIAASIYAAWRSRILSSVINGTLGGLPAPDDMDSLAALRNLLDNVSTRGGIGVSGVDFFAVPGIASAADRRDFVILRSLRAGLDLLATPAFFSSANQNDYRWGRLHRVVFAHPLGSVFSIPPAGGAFPAPLAGVSGISTDGGFQTVDASTHNARGQTPADFMFKDGPAHRTVVEARAGAMRGESIWPGGTSGVLGNPNYFQFLERWLTNETLTLRLGNNEVVQGRVAVEKDIPVEPEQPGSRSTQRRLRAPFSCRHYNRIHGDHAG